MKLLLYCTKEKEIWGDGSGNTWWGIAPDEDIDLVFELNPTLTRLNGKIVAECDCEKVEYFEMEYHHDNQVLQSISKHDLIESEEWKTNWFKTMITGGDNDEKISNCYLLKESCLSIDELGDYVCPNGENNEFYALHLSNLKFFNIPKKINYYGLEKAPMNMCFKRHPVPYDNELGGWEIDRETIIISVHPEHLCKILNGEKTIEVRKQILKELKKEISE